MVDWQTTGHQLIGLGGLRHQFMEDHQLEQEDMGDQEEDQEDQGQPRQGPLEHLGEQELQVLL